MGGFFNNKKIGGMRENEETGVDGAVPGTERGRERD